MEQYFSVAEVAERLSVDPRTVRRWIDEGKLDAIKIHGAAAVRIAESAVQRLLVPARPAGEEAEPCS